MLLLNVFLILLLSLTGCTREEEGSTGDDRVSEDSSEPSDDPALITELPPEEHLPTEVEQSSDAPQNLSPGILPAPIITSSAKLPSGAVPEGAIPASALPASLRSSTLALPASAVLDLELSAFGTGAGALPASALPASALPASALPASALPASYFLVPDTLPFCTKIAYSLSWIWIDLVRKAVLSYLQDHLLVYAAALTVSPKVNDDHIAWRFDGTLGQGARFLGAVAAYAAKGLPLGSLEEPGDSRQDGLLWVVSISSGEHLRDFVLLLGHTNPSRTRGSWKVYDPGIVKRGMLLYEVEWELEAENRLASRINLIYDQAPLEDLLLLQGDTVEYRARPGLTRVVYTSLRTSVTALSEAVSEGEGLVSTPLGVRCWNERHCDVATTACYDVPSLSISEPVPERTFGLGEPVPLVADVSHDRLPPDAYDLAWSSGEELLGFGPEASTDALPAGTVELLLTAERLGRKVAGATRTLEVSGDGSELPVEGE
ncbi:MAG: hypothetical protein A2284_03120 [Deltaproteobacteria bacterium RIFOXYA12_FULL_61_11]|nr:MAG: hypothetical protein A2284_03120 [Deltaproteobacteria bacterium RIFOXYA12_FULL_61_11]